MLKCLNIIFFWILFFPLAADAQNDHPKDDFDPPVDFKMALSGTFGELRSNHFHSGIDIKTWGMENKPLHAIGDGFVSRVAVSPGGFGKAVYIEHPNGYTSVYAHCNSFYDELQKWVKREQYRLESFRINLFPEKGQFPVKKGDIIAYSGNSGSSMGPHLHFEIRKTNGQIPVNPLHFGFQVKDFIRPKISGMRIYPVKPYSQVNGKNKIHEPELAGWGPEYRIKGNDTIRLSGEFYFGINTYDRLNDSKNHNGVYSVSLYIDSIKVYEHRMDAFPFSESRYVNSLIDYGYYKNRKQRFQKTWIEPNNRLSVYSNVAENGIFMFIDNKYHHLRYVVRDVSGNESILSFTVKSAPPEFTDVFKTAQKSSSGTSFNWREDNTFSTDDFEIFIPAGALYDTINFTYKTSDSSNGFYSPMHIVHKPGIPIHTSCRISIRPDEIPYGLREKALIVKVDGDDISASGGEWDGNVIKTSIRNFGTYAVAVDTVAPEIEPLNIRNGKSLSNQKSIKINIRDEISGIKDYEATLNGKWLLMEWDPKNELLFYDIDERLRKGENQFRLEVSDAVGNKTVYKAMVKR